MIDLSIHVDSFEPHSLITTGHHAFFKLEVSIYFAVIEIRAEIEWISATVPEFAACLLDCIYAYRALVLNDKFCVVVHAHN